MRERFRIIKLPLISYCGINFNNRQWHKHLRNCDTCKTEHEKYRNNFINSWDKKCECGCGEITLVGNKRILGHGPTGVKRTEKQLLKYKALWTPEKKAIQSLKWKEDNPQFKEKNKKYGENNPAKRSDVRKKISKNNPMHNIKYAEKARVNRINVGYENTIKVLKNRWDDKKLLEKRVKTYCENLSEGKIKLKNNWKCGNYVRKNGNIEWFDSSYEEIRMKFFDDNNITWTKKHGIRIPYINEKGLNTYYVPDFKIVEDNNIIIEEVKGWIKKNDILKAYVGIEYCKENHYEYRFLLGEDLKYVEELSHKKNKNE
jgi:hypothetical protein